MQVDRSRFLLLTASLAAAACNQPAGPAAPDTGGAEPAKDRGAQDGETDEETHAEPVGAADEHSGGGGGSAVWLEIEPGTERPTDEFGNADCDNTVGTPRSCDLSPPGSHCESFDSTVRLCRSFPGFMQPRAAEAAVDCMLAVSGTQQICDWNIWNQCASAGLQATCVEPATRSQCERISSNCGGSIDVFQCQQALSAVRPHHVPQVASCVQEFCETSFCVTDLSQM